MALEGPATDLVFVIEWRCPECRFEAVMTREEALTAARPILIHAAATGEVTRLIVTRFGANDIDAKRIRSTMSHSREGKAIQTTAFVDHVEDLLQGVWLLGGHRYHVVGTGYYFDLDAKELYFILRWHDRALCGPLEDITDERAAAMA